MHGVVSTPGPHEPEVTPMRHLPQLTTLPERSHDHSGEPSSLPSPLYQLSALLSVDKKQSKVENMEHLPSIT